MRQGARLAGGEGTVYVIENLNWPREGQPAGRRVDKGLSVAQLEISETKSMDAGLVTVNADTMKKAIVEAGRVALYGLYFDTGPGPREEPAGGARRVLIAAAGEPGRPPARGLYWPSRARPPCCTSRRSSSRSASSRWSR